MAAKKKAAPRKKPAKKAQEIAKKAAEQVAEQIPEAEAKTYGKEEETGIPEIGAPFPNLAQVTIPLARIEAMHAAHTARRDQAADCGDRQTLLQELGYLKALKDITAG